VIADAALPVWTIKPNWSDGVIERLSWLTDVIGSSWGTEQRRALRLSPRREFEMKFNPVDQTRSYFDLWLHRFGSQEFMVPLFHDAGKLTAGIAGGAVTIPLDTTYREFVVGGLAVLIGDDPFTFDKVTITGIAADHLTVAAGGVTVAWPKGTRVHPLRRSRLSDESQATALTSRVGDATLQFQLNQANDIPDEGAWDTLYSGYPIILDPPNRRESLDLSFLRNSLVLDNDHGLRVLADDTTDGVTKARAFTVQADNRMMRGRAEHWAFRQMLYRLRGQQGAVWLPSFNRDIELSRAALAADASLNVKKLGYAYTGGAVDGRQHILLPGGLGAKITGTGAPASASEEKLNLAAAVGAALPAGTFGSFMDTCRLASDDIEIQHHTDTDGAAECSLGFRSFRDPRTAPAIISYPIPVTAQGVTQCGEPAPEEASDCIALESGWWFEIVLDLTYGPILGDATHNSYPHTYPGFGFGLTREDGSPYPVGRVLQSSEGDLYTAPVADPVTNRVSRITMRLPISGSTPTDPLADEPSGLPAKFHVFMQFTYSEFSFPEGDGMAIVTFRRPNGTAVTYIRDDTGGPGMEIFGLWPTDYYLHRPGV
jgi:hypothetical protein